METLKELPDSFTIDELFDRLILLEKIDIGREQVKEEKVNSTEEAREKLKKWRK
jgi:hypothetical protein